MTATAVNDPLLLARLSLHGSLDPRSFMTSTDRSPRHSTSRSASSSASRQPSVPQQGVQPWGNLSETLTVAQALDRATLTPSSPYAPSSVGALSSEVLNTDSQEESTYEDTFFDTFHLSIEEDGQTPSQNSALDYDTRTSEQTSARTSEPRTGVRPSERPELNALEIPSLEDQERDRQREVTNADVRSWLSTTPDGSLPKSHDRSRASTLSKTVSTMQRDHLVNPLNPPGPGVLLHVEDDNDDSSDSGSSDAASTVKAVLDYRNEVEDTNRPLAGSANAEAHRHPSWEAHPWKDKPDLEPQDDSKAHPFSSTAAIERFLKQSRDIETASWTATLGSRRRSETDLESLFSASGISVRVTADNQAKGRGPRRQSLLKKISTIPKRSNSNVRKRKSSESPAQKPDSGSQSPSENIGPFPGLRGRINSWGRPKSPVPDKIGDTAFPPSNNFSQSGARSPRDQFPATVPHGSRDPFNFIRTHGRSPSDSGGIADIWRQAGGPMIPLLTPRADDEAELNQSSRSSAAVPRPQVMAPTASEQGKEKISMDLEQFLVPKSSRRADLEAHILTLNPRVHEFLLRRLTEEQHKRLGRLLEHRAKHLAAVRAGKCPSGILCTSLGGQPQTLKPTPKPSQAQQVQVTFLVNPTNEVASLRANGEDDASIQIAQFPEGIPNPPVQSLPAKFECPICYQVKSFEKPSDWSKHVHEDIQPFTCTFPNCAEPRSFKRKADFLRHENERHRQLEKWVCNYPDCPHICFRRDNFVQHLVREHKHPEPRSRPKASRNDIQDPHIAQLLQICRQETSKQPTDEPCHFCDNFLPTWKAHAAHSAKHMEQITLPLIDLVNQLMPAAQSDSRGRTSHLAGGSSSGQRSVSAQPAFPAPVPGGVNNQLSMQYQPPKGKETYSPGGHTFPPPTVSRVMYDFEMTQPQTQQHYSPSSMSYPGSANVLSTSGGKLAPPIEVYGGRQHHAAIPRLDTNVSVASGDFLGPHYRSSSAQAYSADVYTHQPEPVYVQDQFVSNSPDNEVFPTWEEPQAVVTQELYQQQQQAQQNLGYNQESQAAAGYIPNYQYAPTKMDQQYMHQSLNHNHQGVSAATYPPPMLSISPVVGDTIGYDGKPSNHQQPQHYA